jgi:hypothetical protein
MFREQVLRCPECNEKVATLIENIMLERAEEFSQPTVRHGMLTAPNEEHSHGYYRHQHIERHEHSVTLKVEYLDKTKNELVVGERTFVA